QRLHAMKRLDADPVCCNGWFGPAPGSYPVEHPDVLVAVLPATETFLGYEGLSRLREPIPHDVAGPGSLPNQLGLEHQRFPFPAQPGLNLQAAVVADHLLTVRGELDGEGIAGPANNVGPGEVEPWLAVLNHESCGIRRGYLQRTPAAAKLPDPGEI